MNLIRLTFLFFVAGQMHAQEVKWAINIENHGYGLRSFVTDDSSNVYHYGFYRTNFNGFKNGSTWMKYSNTGLLLSTVNFSKKLYIQKLIHDGKDDFYFAGYFLDTLKFGSTTLLSNGDCDGVVGKIDEEGNIIWVSGFGGENVDYANSLTFNDNGSELVVTGRADSNVYVGKIPLGLVSKAMFIGVFDLKGALKKFRFFDFVPTENHLNEGLEISKSQDGYFILGDREGTHWYEYPAPAGPEEGRYIFKLDNNLNIQWSRFIISQSCYYGYGCQKMSVSNDCFVPSYCSSKYGGTGRLQRFDATTGEITWSLINNDGAYSDTYTSNNLLYYVGTEDANHCPCEGSDPGYGVVKIMDSQNKNLMLLRQHNYSFHTITRAIDGTIYVAGYTHETEPSLIAYAVKPGNFLVALQDPYAIRKNKAHNLRFALFPNPSAGKFQVTCEKTIEEISVLDINQTVWHQSAPNTKACEVSDLLPGFYLVRVKSEAEEAVVKLIVAD